MPLHEDTRFYLAFHGVVASRNSAPGFVCGETVLVSGILYPFDDTNLPRELSCVCNSAEYPVSYGDIVAFEPDRSGNCISGPYAFKIEIPLANVSREVSEIQIAGRCAGGIISITGIPLLLCSKNDLVAIVRNAHDYSVKYHNSEHERVFHEYEARKYKHEVAMLHSSLSWRLTGPLRKILDFVFQLKYRYDHLKKYSFIRYVFDVLNYRSTDRKLPFKPLISVVVPVYNVNPVYLDKCIRSVTKQLYTNWELCLYDDCSTNDDTLRCLKRWEDKDKRIKIQYGTVNQHISGASNAAISLSSGQFISLLDNDDVLTPDALLEVVKVLNRDRCLDYIYSDEDKINENGSFSDTFYKADFDVDMLLSYNYLCHFSTIRRTLGDSIGWFRKGYEGAQDYDLFLRLSEKTKAIAHIPKVLYHWRRTPGSTAAGFANKDYASINTKKLLEDYCARNGIQAAITTGKIEGSFRVKRVISIPQKITIIIPFRDKVDYLKRCLKSIFERTEYPNYELMLVNNNSSEPDTLSYLRSLSGNRRVNILDYPHEFNYAAMMNWAVERCQTEYLLLLNNDTEVINTGWLSSMAEHIQRGEVAAVGCKLLFPSGTIQHAGVFISTKHIAGHGLYNRNNDNHHHGWLNVVRGMNACTAACLLLKKSVYEECGGMDAEGQKIAYNDVDLCLKMRERGYLIVYTPYAELYHYESVSRGYEDDPVKQKRFDAERENMREKWQRKLGYDEYYNINLSDDFNFRY